MSVERAGSGAPRLYRWLLRLYPGSFRQSVGPAMVETFADELGAARKRGRGAVLALWLRALAVTPVLALEERLHEAGDARPRRLAGWVQDGRWAARSLMRSPGFVAVTVLTVALGAGATTALFSIGNALLLRPLPVEEAERLVRVHELRSRILSSGMEGPRIPYDRYLDLEEATRGIFTGLAGHNYRNLSMRAEGPAFPVSGVIASANYFEVLGVQASAGRLFTRDDEPVVVLSHRLWQQRFGGTPDILGRSVYVNGLPFTVAGVAAREFGGTIGVLSADVWVPYRAHGAAAWENARVNTFARLRPGVEVVPAAELAGAAARRLAPVDDPEADVLGVELERMEGLPGSMAGSVRAFLGMLLATAVLVLLIAGANVAGMLLARSVTRRREIAVRLALGVGRARLLRQLLLESVGVFVLGGVAGMLVAWWATRALARIRLPDPEIVLDLSPDLRVLGFALVTATLTGVVFGLMPAVQSARGDVASVLVDGGRGTSRRGRRARDAFVGAQMAMSVLLLVVAALFVRTVQRSMSSDPGFSSDGVLLATTNLGPLDYDEARGRAFYAQLVERTRALPGVESVALADVALLTGENETFGGWRSEPDAEGTQAGQNAVDGAYFETMEVDLVEGRGIAPTDVAGAPRVVVVNETFARRFWPDGNALGRTILRGTEPYEVVGVVRDGMYVQFGEATAPFTFLSSAQRYSPQRVLHVRLRPAASRGEVISGIRTAVAGLDPDVAVNRPTMLSDAIGFLLFPQRFAAWLVGLFGLLGLTLAAVGVYGVLAHNVAQRGREFGIRIALGAEGRQILSMILRHGAVLAITGTAAGLIGAFALTRFIRGFLHGVSPLDVPTFVGVPLVLGAVALLASTLPARRALRMDPVEALRQE